MVVIKKNEIFKVLLHISPLIPLYFDRFYLFLALFLVVILFYIKSFKLKVHEDEVLEKCGVQSQQHEVAIRERERWKKWTFL